MDLIITRYCVILVKESLMRKKTCIECALNRR